MSDVMEQVGGWTGKDTAVTAQPSRELAGWVQSIQFENMEELFGNAIEDFGEAEIRSHLAELADWTARELARRVAWDQIGAFLSMAGANYNLKWLRRQAQENPSWRQVLDCVLLQAPEYYFEEMLPQWGQSQEGVGATAGAGVSR